MGYTFCGLDSRRLYGRKVRAHTDLKGQELSILCQKPETLEEEVRIMKTQPLIQAPTPHPGIIHI